MGKPKIIFSCCDYLPLYISTSGKLLRKPVRDGPNESMCQVRPSRSADGVSQSWNSSGTEKCFRNSGMACRTLVSKMKVSSLYVFERTFVFSLCPLLALEIESITSEKRFGSPAVPPLKTIDEVESVWITLKLIQNSQLGLL